MIIKGKKYEVFLSILIRHFISKLKQTNSNKFNNNNNGSR